MCKIVKSSRVQGFEREFFSFNSREVLDESEERVKLHGLPSFRYFSIAYIVSWVYETKTVKKNG